MDNEGQIWAAVPGSLLRYPDDAASVRMLLPGELANDSLLSVAIDRQGRIWLGTWQTYFPDEPHPTIYRKGIATDGQGYRLGVSGGQGLYRFHPQMGWTTYSPCNSGLTATSSVTTLVADRQGRVWFGSHDGEFMRAVFGEAGSMQLSDS